VQSRAAAGWLPVQDEAVKFVLEVDMGDTAFDGNAASELGRILRYWGGNLNHYQLVPGDGSAIYDSGYHEVGRWAIIDASTSSEA
jgi:hypothetical protein